MSVLEVLGRTHSRVLQWDVTNGTLIDDLAVSWEQPEPTTLVLHLNPAARWHDRAPVNGRALTADDVVKQIERGRQLAKERFPAVQRLQDLAGIRAVAAIDGSTVRIDSAAPDPLLVQALAARFALVQAPEAVAQFEGTWHAARPESVIGTGPFRYRGSATGDVQTFDAVTGGHRSPHLQEIVLFPPAPDDRERFLASRVDEVTSRDRRDATAIRAASPSAVELARFEDAPVISTLYAGRPPWNNPELRLAISGALNRVELGARLFGGRAAPASPVGPPSAGDGMSGPELAGFAGYEVDFEAAKRTARQRWEAAGGSGLGAVTIDYPSIFDPVYSSSSIVTGMLNEALGGQFRAAVETYTVISAKAVAQRYGGGEASFWFGWGPPFVEPDPARQLGELYSSNGPGFGTTGFTDSAVDSLLASLAVEFDQSRRSNLVRNVARRLLELGGGGVFDWLLQRQEVFRWPYFNGRSPSPWPDQWRDAAAFLDPADDSFARRPAG